jgi:hypothetical protein
MSGEFCPFTVPGGVMPFKANAKRRHHIPKRRHGATNSAAYDAALRQRGSVIVWFTDAAIAAWNAKPPTTRGGQIDPLLDQVDGRVASLTADGGYDQDGVYAEIAARHPEASVIVPPRCNVVPSDTVGTGPTTRDRHL